MSVSRSCLESVPQPSSFICTGFMQPPQGSPIQAYAQPYFMSAPMSPASPVAAPIGDFRRVQNRVVPRTLSIPVPSFFTRRFLLSADAFAGRRFGPPPPSSSIGTRGSPPSSRRTTRLNSSRACMAASSSSGSSGSLTPSVETAGAAAAGRDRSSSSNRPWQPAAATGVLLSRTIARRSSRVTAASS